MIRFCYYAHNLALKLFSWAIADSLSFTSLRRAEDRNASLTWTWARAAILAHFYRFSEWTSRDLSYSISGIFLPSLMHMSLLARGQSQAFRMPPGFLWGCRLLLCMASPLHRPGTVSHQPQLQEKCCVLAGLHCNLFCSFMRLLKLCKSQYSTQKSKTV